MKRRLFVTPLTILLVFALALPTFAASKKLGVSEIDQNKDQWCWDACSEMIGKYYNSSSDRDQYDICQYVKGNTNNQSGTSSDICKAIKYASVDKYKFTTKESALSFSACQTEIDNGDPFVIWLSSSTIAHVIVGAGYQTGSTNSIYTIDPSPNVDKQYFSYTDLVNGTTGTLGTRKYGRTMLRK